MSLNPNHPSIHSSSFADPGDIGAERFQPHLSNADNFSEYQSAYVSDQST